MHSALRFLILCILWYTSSAVSNTLGKSILNENPYPVTLTFIQFLLTSLFSFIYCYIFGNLKRLDIGIIKDIGPMAIFQICGHVFSSTALTYITVSFSHTIKVSPFNRPYLPYSQYWHLNYIMERGILRVFTFR